MPDHLGDVAGYLETVGDGDGELRMGPSDLQGVPLPLGEGGEHHDEVVHVLEDDLHGRLELESGRGIDDVVGCGAEVDVLAGVPLALLGHRLDHGHQIVAGLLLDLLDPVDADDVEARHAGDLVRGGLGDRPKGRMRPGEGGLHEHLDPDAAILAEYGLHIVAAVTVVQGTDVAH